MAEELAPLCGSSATGPFTGDVVRHDCILDGKRSVIDPGANAVTWRLARVAGVDTGTLRGDLRAWTY